MSAINAVITIPNIGPTPVRYTLAPGQLIRPESVVAIFDGSGAAGAFLAACAFYAQDGTLIGRFPIGAPIAAGDVAEVSFAPFLRQPSAGGGSATSQGAPGNYIWNKPAGATLVQVICLGAGGGGSTGNDTSFGSPGGGSGGGGGAVAIQQFLASSLPASVPYVVGAGGAGGVGLTANGANGGASTFGAPALLIGGGGGGGGGFVGGGGGGTAGSANIRIGGAPRVVAGGAAIDAVDGQGPDGPNQAHSAGGNAIDGGGSGASGSDVAANAPGGGSSVNGGPGGGGGGTPAGGDTAGSPGGGHGYTPGGGGAVGTPGHDGANVPYPYAGTAGGGSSFVAGVNGFAGGNGGLGAGGGGSACVTLGFLHGNGGRGGDGAVIIIVS